MTDTSLENRVDRLARGFENGRKLIGGLIAVIVVLFGAGVFYATAIADYDKVKADTANALALANDASAKVTVLESSYVPGFAASDVASFSETLPTGGLAWPTKEKALGAQRFCALSTTETNSHTNSACKCKISQDSSGWSLEVANGSDIPCVCGATCIK